MPTKRKLRVFICHASQDKPVARELYRQLLAEGWIDPWLDEEKLLPGQDWEIEIEKAVEAADAVIICLSHASVTKDGYIQKELRFALDSALTKPLHTSFVIPLRLDNSAVPRQFTGWQWLSYFPENTRKKAYQKLLSALRFRVDEAAIDNVKSPKEVEQYDVSNVLIKDALSRVFVSYSRKDIDFVRLLATDLQRVGFDVWWDISGIQGGDNWVRTIQDALDKSRFCAVVVTPDRMKSTWVEREYTYAINNNLKIVPIFLKTCKMPFAFSTTHYIDFRQNRYSVAIKELYSSLKK